MSFNRIDRLVTNEGFFFQSWDDRYSKGVWAALGLNDNHIDIVRDLSSAGDLDMIHAMDYMLYTNWLPYVTAPTFVEAMQKLEDRLSSIPQDQINRNSQWAKLVSKAIDDLGDATRGRSMYDNQPDFLDDLPKDFVCGSST